MWGMIGQEWETLPWQSEKEPECLRFKDRLKAELGKAVRQSEGEAVFLTITKRKPLFLYKINKCFGKFKNSLQ